MIRKIKENWFEDWANKKLDENVYCPFCNSKIKEEIPENLKLKNIEKIIKKIHENIKTA